MNLAVGGGGVFAGGFVSTHTGEIPIESITSQLTSYLTDFEQIVTTYAAWSESILDLERHDHFLNTLPARAGELLRLRRTQATRVTSTEATPFDVPSATTMAETEIDSVTYAPSKLWYVGDFAHNCQ